MSLTRGGRIGTGAAHYRPDIDGLRAIAVLGVVAFHYDLALPQALGLWLGRILHRPSGLVSLFPRGGFVGVDIFFVISGYLIGGILKREQERNGRISLKRFYERRIRRIVPAFAVVLLFTDLVSWFGLLPSQMKEFAQSATASILSCSNLYFWKTTGYFDAPAFSQPLLHTWSLAVEEQFYLVFPLLLVAMQRLRLVWQRLVLLSLASVSLLVSAALLKADRSAAFYLPTSRAWELLVGVLLAFGLFPKLKTKSMRDTAALVGAGLIGYALFRYTNQMLFPGFAALVPCCGTLLLLAAGEDGGCRVSQILAAPPLVGIGLVSYSLYLWHWPLLLANRYEWFVGLHVQQATLLLLLAPLSYVSWRFIEQPFRVGGVYASRRMIYSGAACIGLTLAILNGWALETDGMRYRFNAQELSLNEALSAPRNTGSWKNGCFVSDAMKSLQENCLESSSTQANVLIFGDSQAAQLWSGLTHTFPSTHFLVATGSSCKPLLSSYTSKDQFCRDMVRNILGQFLPSGKISIVMMASLWTNADVPSLLETLTMMRHDGVRVYIFGQERTMISLYHLCYIEKPKATALALFFVI